MDKTDAPTDRAKPAKDAMGSAGRSVFVSAALDMSWKLAVAVLVPLLVGVQLDKKLNSAPLYTLVGLVLAFAGSAVVMWRAMQAANRLPVPKLSPAQKRVIQKSYEEDDE
ncbi:MAG TPA: AtpZ/AtpI family protein [Patescibacteria group bacterium]|nr:AtpZ/AtpI family protein [Patescibacteria group bacterium]